MRLRSGSVPPLTLLLLLLVEVAVALGLPWPVVTTTTSAWQFSTSLTTATPWRTTTTTTRGTSRLSVATTTTTTTTATTASNVAVPRLLDPTSSVAAGAGAFKSGDKSSSPEAQLETVEFPPPLSLVQRLQRAATFWATAMPIIASYYALMARLQIWENDNNNNNNNNTTAADVEALWKDLHATSAAKLSATITDLKGFYVKTAQIISSRHDLFPAEYTDALSGFTDSLDPMPASLARAVVVSELLHSHESFDDVFCEFDDVPLGSASVAQVHRAVLTEKYGGKQVAVKIQRPSIESKLMGDIANLKAIAKLFRNSPALPLDYYTGTCV
jgi:ABC1 atypical kinase-like domain